jgi:tRNA threonylcarbamoyl adenosine modification protein YeaZ
MIREPLILAIETALRDGSLTLLQGEREIASDKGKEKVSRAEDLLGSISALFEKNNLRLSQIDFLAVSEGPGSFTGIRIGMATARALAFGINRSLYGVSLSEAVAYSAGIVPIVSIIPSVKGTVIWQEFENFFLEGRTPAPQVYDLQEASKKIDALGSGAPKIVLESNLYESLIEPKLYKEKDRFICASDNASGLIGLFSLYLYKNNFSQHFPSPNYLLEAEIGRK